MSKKPLLRSVGPLGAISSFNPLTGPDIARIGNPCKMAQRLHDQPLCEATTHVNLTQILIGTNHVEQPVDQESLLVGYPTDTPSHESSGRLCGVGHLLHSHKMLDQHPEVSIPQPKPYLWTLLHIVIVRRKVTPTNLRSPSWSILLYIHSCAPAYFPLGCIACLGATPRRTRRFQPTDRQQTIYDFLSFNHSLANIQGG